MHPESELLNSFIQDNYAELTGRDEAGCDQNDALFSLVASRASDIWRRSDELNNFLVEYADSMGVIPIYDVQTKTGGFELKIYCA